MVNRLQGMSTQSILPIHRGRWAPSLHCFAPLGHEQELEIVTLLKYDPPREPWKSLIDYVSLMP